MSIILKKKKKKKHYSFLNIFFSFYFNTFVFFLRLRYLFLINGFLFTYETPKEPILLYMDYYVWIIMQLLSWENAKPKERSKIAIKIWKFCFLRVKF